MRRLFAKLAPAVAFVDDRINAIVVKDIRQSVKSRIMVITFMTILGLSLLISMLTATGNTPDSQSMVIWLSVLELLVGFVVVPFGAFRGMMAEIQEKTNEMVLITGIRPFRIMEGKLSSVFSQLLVYYSAIAPFVAFAYLRGRIDILSAIIPSILIFVFSVLIGLLGIVFGATVRRDAARVLASVFFVLFCLFLSWVGFALLSVLASQFRSFFFNDEALIVVGSILAVLILVVFSMAFASGVTRFMPESANRSGPVRVTGFLVMILSSAAMGVVCLSLNERGVAEDVLVWVTGTLYIMATYSLASSSVAPAGISTRVRRSISSGGPWPYLIAPFLPGPGFGIIYGIIMFGLVIGAKLVVLAAWTFTSSSNARFDDGMLSMLVIPLYAMIYYGFGALILGAFKGKWPKGVLNFCMFPIVALLLLLIEAVGGTHGTPATLSLTPIGPMDDLTDRSVDPGEWFATFAALIFFASVAFVCCLPKIIRDYRGLYDAVARNKHERRAAQNPLLGAAGPKGAGDG